MSKLTVDTLAELKRFADLEQGVCIPSDTVRQLIAAAEREERLLRVIEQCDIVMDTAATLGLPQDLPQVYRDSWAAAHLAARGAGGPADMTYTLDSLKQLTGPALSVAVAELVYGKQLDEEVYGAIIDPPHADPTAALAAWHKVREKTHLTIDLANDGVGCRIYLDTTINVDSTGADPGDEFATAVSRAACVIAWMKREEKVYA